MTSDWLIRRHGVRATGDAGGDVRERGEKK